ncbi:MAG TPA: hypothetical protein VN665_00155 [Candidatus Paceibacterota bacterium]|nr:hypothetical protein [Candidatus Paceibacterota bacterium]
MVDAEGSRLPDWDPPLKLDGKAGGCLCVTDHMGQVYLKAFIGKVPSEKLSKYWTLAEQKATRLSDHIPYARHISSWQSRNPTNNHWGGAIKAPRHVYSFSGLPEMYDEAFMLLLATELSELKVEDAAAIAAISSNPHWRQLAERYGALASN